MLADVQTHSQKYKYIDSMISYVHVLVHLYLMFLFPIW